MGGRPVSVDVTSARLDDETLAGSILTLDAAVPNVVAWTGAGSATALRMADEVRATVLGLDRVGRSVVGLEVDLALFDAEPRVKAPVVHGRSVYQRVKP